MIVEISSLIASSKAAYDIAKGIDSLKSEVDRNESISRILEVLLSIQRHALSVNAIAQKLQEEKHELTIRIMELEKWHETEMQYELREVASGIFVYAYKVTDNPTKPMHWLCPKCFQEKKPHIIQLDRKSAAGTNYFRAACSMKFQISSAHEPSKTPGPGAWS
jgi:hypothetical protein